MAGNRKSRELIAAPSPLLTDSYHLSMAQAYLDHGLTQPAVFEFFARRLPAGRNFLIAAGLEQVLEFLESFRFGADDIEWLRSTGRYRPNLLDYLRDLRFSGDVWAMPEGTPFFQNEPILRVKAALPEAQILETRVINLLHLQSMIASKASRCFLAAQDKLLVDFGLRRAHGAEAGLFAARASYLAGFHGTSTVLAGALFGIPVFGTMAHSFIEAHDEEAQAFENFARSNPGNTILLVDTYDTEAATDKVVTLAAKLKKEGIIIAGVRLDSGNLLRHARQVRDILDRGGLKEAGIFVSGSVDEFMIRELLSSGAPVDGFGIGTHMTTSEDAPFLDCAYKIQEYAGIPRSKRSEGKATIPGAKQVFRNFDPDLIPAFDIVALEQESQPGIPLLQPIMKNGIRLISSAPLRELRETCFKKVASLPAALRSIVNQHTYEVRVSEALQRLVRDRDRAAA